MLLKKFSFTFGNMRGVCQLAHQKCSLSASTTASAKRIIDLRSDTLTLPSEGMKNAMMNAVVADDVFEEDPTVNEFQQYMANKLGKEAGLLVCSGSMGNLISLMLHCSVGRDNEVLLGDKSHIHLYEQGSLAGLAGIHHRTLPNEQDGTFDLDLARDFVRPVDPHHPKTAAICVENTHNRCGGAVLPIDFLKKVRNFADEFELKVHMDGARLMNAAVYLNEDPKEIAKYADSVSICFSKNLGAPMGSIIVGDKEFIYKARRQRKALGGGLRQAYGMIAAAAKFGYDNAVNVIQNDHRNAQVLCQALVNLNQRYGHRLLHLNPSDVQTNIIFFTVKAPFTAPEVCNALLDSIDDDFVNAKEKDANDAIVKMSCFSKTNVRMVTHMNISEEDIKITIEKFNLVFKRLLK